MNTTKLYGFDNNGKFEVKDENGKLVKTYSCQKSYEYYCNVNDVILGSAPIEAQKPIHIDINKRFDFVERITRMILQGITPSLFLTGDGGLGKSHTVLEELSKANLEEEADYLIVKGYSTAKGLFRTLYENRDKLIIFDDCDSILKDQVSQNLLKTALDSYDRRIITWNAEFVDDSLPNSFEFTGRVIFISNIPMDSINQAIKSRSMIIDLFMSADEKISRMEFILPKVMPKVSMEDKQVCIEVLKKYKNITKDLNTRTLMKIIKLKVSQPDDIFEDMAVYMLQS